ncbi:MAG: TIGR04282 family arsenosugar biosynthesis glycosyltransferase [Bacteroidia bacterium]
MKNRLLITFVKHPIAGQVKTRLAAGVGHEAAIAIYQKLLLQTRSAAQGGDWDVQIWYGNSVPEHDLWQETGWPRALQQGEDLGARMHFAMSKALEEGYEHVALIGSDLAEMDTLLLEDAFEKLEEYDTILGPSADGGFYLIGLKKAMPRLFLSKSWSHDQVLEQAIEQIKKENCTLHLLPVCHDVDTQEDLVYLNL